MTFRRRQPATRISASSDDFRSPLATGGSPRDDSGGPPSPAPSSIAAQAIRASAAHRDASSLSSAYGEHAISSPLRETLPTLPSTSAHHRDSASSEYKSIDSLNESKYGFLSLLARKTKALVEDDYGNKPLQTIDKNEHQIVSTFTGNQSREINQKTGAAPRKSSDALASSLNYIGGTIKNAFEEGFTIVENKTADIIHETRKLNIGRKGIGFSALGQNAEKLGQQNFPQIQTDYETQLKVSRDVANAMTAKAKLLLRELKTVKADLNFANERCTQLEEENKVLRESCEKGDSPEDEDLIRLQLETLLAEKARLANENSIYARENRFLREIVEYHQLTMQDVVYVDEGMEEVSEVFSTPTISRVASEAAMADVPNSPTYTMAHNGPSTTIPPPSTLYRAVSAAILVPEDCPIFLKAPEAPTLTDAPKAREQLQR